MHDVMIVYILYVYVCIGNHVIASTIRVIVRVMFWNSELSEDKLRSGQQVSTLQSRRFLLEDNFNCAGLVSITNCILFR